MRGLAVGGVLLFHLNLNFAKTGYLGVDVFFVISGFLMAMLYGNITNIKESAKFYLKRAIRILPAYWFTIAFTSIIVFLFCLPHEIVTVKGHAIWAFLLLPNIGFWKEAEYWGGSYFRPFLHLWSLGVEIQFYLIYPLISKFLNSNKKRIFMVIFSLSLYIVLNQVSAKTAFYFMPARLWQFMLGILAFSLCSAIKTKHINQISNILFFLLLVSLLLPMNLETKNVYLITIPVSILAMATIMFLFLDNNTKSSKTKYFLSLLGKYSFSIYLVHYPVIIFFNYYPFGYKSLNESTFPKFLIFIFLGYVLFKSYYYFFETKFKHKLRWKNIIIFGLLSLSSFSIFSSFTNVFINRFSLEEKQISEAWLDQSSYRCGKIFKIFNPMEKFCPIGNADHKNKVLLIGNSHADSIKVALATKLNARNISLLFNVQNHAISHDQIEEILQEVKKSNIESVVFHARSGTTDLTALGEIVEELHSMKIKTSYIMPVPEYSFSIPSEVYKSLRENRIFPYSDIDDYSDFNSEEIERVFLLRDKFNLIVYETARLLCAPECAIRNDSGLFYFDPNHLTLIGSQQLDLFFDKIASNFYLKN